MARSDRKLDQEIEAFLNEVRSWNYLIAFFSFFFFLNKIKRKLYCIVLYTHSHTVLDSAFNQYRIYGVICCFRRNLHYCLKIKKLLKTKKI